jgi:hypothetical protein
MQLLDEQAVKTMIGVLSDKYARSIVFCTTASPKSVEEVSKQTKIPISTCYRRIHELLSQGVLVIDRIIITSDGRKFETYKSAVKDAKIDIAAGKITVEAVPNVDASGRLYNSWMKLKPSEPSSDKSALNVVATQSGAGNRINTTEENTLDLDRLVPERMAPLLRDCDVCHTQYIQCHTFYSRQFARTVFVCQTCETRIPMKKVILAK